LVSFFALKRVRIMRGGTVAFDENFHRGVNIIRGENSSGKSTISDFIFFGLGGEYDRWKDAAKQCSSVRLEVETEEATLTVHRSVGNKTEPIYVYYGSLEESLSKGVDQWQRVPIRRPSGGNDLSFTQVLFRAAGIPEAPSANNSNITMHQVLRLLYSDQQTPAGKIFRFESFDTREIREAVGNLLIGYNGYELYEALIKLRELKSAYEEKDRLYRAAQLALPPSEGLVSIFSLNQKLSAISLQKDRLTAEIQKVDDLVDANQSEQFISDRRMMRLRLRKLANEIHEKETKISDENEEKKEIQVFIDFLKLQLDNLIAADNISGEIGSIEFQYCPSCLKPLADDDGEHCIVCHEILDRDDVKSKYFELKIDNELQIRESYQLLKSKSAEIDSLQIDLRSLRRDYSKDVAEFSARYDVSNSPRESFLAERNKSIGSLEREFAFLEELRAIVERIDQLSRDRADLNDQIDRLNSRVKRLESASNARINRAMTSISTIGRRILKKDLPREDTFEDPEAFSISFGDDAMLVDGKMNFAESSNVVLKNTAILSIFLSACYDSNFWHPKFILMDNIEDKGMEPERSHNFQRLIVEESNAAKFPHQIIFTTSMIDPALENSGLTVGPKYTRTNKTLS